MEGINTSTTLLGKEIIDFVIYFPYNSTEMEVGRKHIHVLCDSYEIWQRHFVSKISKGQRSRAEAAEVSGIDSGSDDETEQEKGEEQEEKDRSNLTPLVVVFYLLFFCPSPLGDVPQYQAKTSVWCMSFCITTAVLIRVTFLLLLRNIPQTNFVAELDDEWTSPLTIGEFLTVSQLDICFMIYSPLGGSRRRYWHWMVDEPQLIFVGYRVETVNNVFPHYTSPTFFFTLI